MQKEAQNSIYCIQTEVILQENFALSSIWKVLDISFGTIVHSVLECFPKCSSDYGKIHFFLPLLSSETEN